MSNFFLQNMKSESLESLNDYLIRKRENGFDNRGGSLAAWFLVSLYELEG